MKIFGNQDCTNPGEPIENTDECYRNYKFPSASRWIYAIVLKWTLFSPSFLITKLIEMMTLMITIRTGTSIRVSVFTYWQIVIHIETPNNVIQTLMKPSYFSIFSENLLPYVSESF